MASIQTMKTSATITLQIDRVYIQLISSPTIINTIEFIWHNHKTTANTSLQLTIREDITKIPNKGYKAGSDYEDISFENNIFTFSSPLCTGTFTVTDGKGEVSIPPVLEKNMLPLKATLISIFGYYLLQEQKLLLHACGIENNNKGYLFLGAPGAGKSTLAKKHPSKELLGDECVGIKKEQETIKLFSTPFPGDISPITKKETSLQELFVLEKNKPLGKLPLSKKEVFYSLLEHNLLFMVLDKRSPELFKQIIRVSNYYCKEIQASKISSQKKDNIWKVI